MAGTECSKCRDNDPHMDWYCNPCVGAMRRELAELRKFKIGIRAEIERVLALVPKTPGGALRDTLVLLGEPLPSDINVEKPRG